METLFKFGNFELIEKSAFKNPILVRLLLEGNLLLQIIFITIVIFF